MYPLCGGGGGLYILLRHQDKKEKDRVGSEKGTEERGGGMIQTVRATDTREGYRESRGI